MINAFRYAGVVGSRHVCALVLLTVMTACATQGPDRRPAPALAAAWANAGATPGASTPSNTGEWWRVLGDPVVDRLVGQSLASNPTLGEALARVDQAAAELAGNRAARLPRVDLSAGITRARTAAGSTAARSTTATIGPSLSWEVDLWGRLREQASASRSRLDARNADAADARLSVAAQIADGVVVLRACRLSLSIRDNDISSRIKELTVARARLAFGNIAPAEVAATEANLAAARTDRIATDADCRRATNILVALTGEAFAAVDTLVQMPTAGGDNLAGSMPRAPGALPALPVMVLLRHPSVVAADREVAARWSEIAVSRAERLPRLDLAAGLSGQWLSALGSTAGNSLWSVGAGLSAPLLDGGAGAANVRRAQARYREALATLVLALRNAARDVEDALVDQQSAVGRAVTAGQALTAARFTLRANEARWRAGAIASFELESSRRDFDAAQDGTVLAARDQARAWIQLIRTTGSTDANQEQDR